MQAATGRPMPEIKFFQMSTVDDRRLQGPRVAPRHGRAARLGAVRAVGRSRDRAHGAARGRRRVWHPTRRRAHLSDEHARIGLDSVASAGRLLGQGNAAVPRVARRHELRGDGVARRELRREEHRGLLPHAVRARLRRVRAFDHEFVGRKALEKLAKKPSRRKVTLAWNGDDVRQALGTLFQPAATSRSTSTCRSRTTQRCHSTRS